MAHRPQNTAADAISSSGAGRRRRTWQAWLRRRWPLLYLVALGASAIVQTLTADSPDDHQRPAASTITLSAMGDEGREPGQHQIALRAWPAPVAGDGASASSGNAPPPVLMIHGSPGDSSNFEELAPELAARGWTVLAPDLPGFGLSRGEAPSYSSLAQARSMVALLDALKIDRAHIVGWSSGGAVGLWMADLEPDRIASLTLLAGTGAQHTEGSGSYFFEHVKYAVGVAVLVGGAELVPHFGLLGSRQSRWAFTRNFWDSDQRPLEAVMRSLDTPTLILHGRDDFLVAPWAAEEHQRLIGSSRLVITDHDHFMPLLAPEETAGHLAPFLTRHNAPGAPALVQVADLAPRPEREGVVGGVERAAESLRRIPWWAEALALGALAALSRWLALSAAGYLVGVMALDFGVATVALLLGALLQRSVAWWRAGHASSRWLDPGTLLRAAGRLTGLLARSLVAVAIVGAMAYLLVDAMVETLGLAGLGLWIAAAPALVVIGRSAATWPGRQRLKARIGRLWRHEFWPWYVFYAPLLPGLAWLGMRSGGIMTFTCVNPALEAGGGVIGESKTSILDLLGADSAVLAHELLPARPDGDATARFEQLQNALETRPELGGWPIILKPDRGERGYAVRLCRQPDEAVAYLREIEQDVIAQRYHPGPHECGIFWVRDDQAPHGGRIFSITRKHFQTVTGDGRRTLEALVLADPRLRMQSNVFLRRFERQRRRVLAPGEKLRMSESGNHAQGALFRDGADLATDALTARLGEMLGRIRDADGTPGFDLGRLDVRYVSDDELRRGGGFALIELNGATSESTNMYDPGRSVLWAWGVLLRQWAAVYRLGAKRRAEGIRPLRPLELARLVARERSGRRAISSS